MRRLLIAFLACVFAISAAQAVVGPRRTLLSGHKCKDPLALSVSCGASVYAVDVQSTTANLVGYWRQTEKGGTTIKDYSSGHNNATVAGTVTLGSTALNALAPADTSALFGGGYETLASSSIFNWAYTQPWTVEAIIRPNVTRSGTTSQWSIFSKMLSATTLAGFEINLAYGQTGGGCTAITCINVYMISNFGTGAYIQINSSADISNAANHHIVVSYTGTGTAAGFSILVDGIQQTININHNALAAGSITNAVAPTIGARNAGAAIPFAGNIQELAVYNTAGSVNQTSSLLASSITGMLTAGTPFRHYGVGLLGRAAIQPYPGIPNLIVDTEGFNDAEAPIGIALAAVLHNRGEVNLVGMIEDGIHTYGADSDYAYLKWVLPSITTSFVGAWQGAVPGTPADTSQYATLVSSTFGTSAVRSTYADGVQKIRSLLAAQPDHSVIITAGGYYTVLQGLMNSAANAGGDGLPSGTDLITSKVFRLIPVATCYQGTASPGCVIGDNYNATNGPAASAEDVFTNWPGEIVETQIPLGSAVVGGPQELTTNGTTAAGNATLHFAATTAITPGMIIYDKTTTGLIPPGTTVVSTTSTTVVMSANATGAGVGGTDVIAFNSGFALPVQITTNGTTAVGNPTLHFASTTGAVDGQLVSDITNSARIPGGTYVVSHTSTTVTMSANAVGTVGGSDVISFNGGPVQYAWSKWRTYTSNSPPEAMWNEMNILYAARGANSGMEVAGLRGTNTLNASTAANAWTQTAGNSTYLTAFASPLTFRTLFNEVYRYLPGAFP